MKKFFITGSNGQLGRELTKQLNELKFPNVGYDVPELDITDYEASLKLIENENPDIIVNCAALTNVDGCETDQELAYQVNTIGAKNMAKIANILDIPIIQVSTDYVFEGNDNLGRPYIETDEINPQSVYGETKAKGEEEVKNETDKYFIIRTAWLYGDGHNFVKTMLKLADKYDQVSVVNDQVGSPTSTVDLAKAIINLADTDAYGIYHGTCEGVCSWADFAQEIFNKAGKNTIVNPVSSEEYAKTAGRPVAQRPSYSVLENKGLKNLNLNNFRNWHDSLDEYLEVLEEV